ncbi:MAG: gas vesicle protein [Syntrophobacteraceae bacterium]
MTENSPLENRNVSLCEVLDRVLHKGAVISGEVTIAVADVELVRLGLQLVLASSGTLMKALESMGDIDGDE